MIGWVIAASMIIAVYLFMEWVFVADDKFIPRGCRKIFGFIPRNHVQPRGYYGAQDPGYGKLHSGVVDGIGTMHCTITVKCARCNENFTAMRVHVPGDVELYDRRK